MTNSAKPRVVVLGANFAGLGAAQKIREYCGDTVDITMIDRKSYLLFIPNLPAVVFENEDPALHLRMDIFETVSGTNINFIKAEILGLDVERKEVSFQPNERVGTETVSMRYDYLVIAVGARLAYDRIEGFGEYGDTVSDIYHSNRLRNYLFSDQYQGGPIAIGSARFHQGNGAEGLEPYPGGSIPYAEAACEGPPLEGMLSMATWLKNHGRGGPDKITVFTPGKVIAEDAGLKVVHQLLDVASNMGFHYMNETQDIKRITREGIEFTSGKSIEAELKIIFPDWVAVDFLRGLPISDNMGFVITDLLMRNPKYPEVFACGDAAAVTVPKLGAIGHQECAIVGKQIAKDLGRLQAQDADQPLQPVTYCIGDMGNNQAFYIRSNSWFGGPEQVLKIGHIPYLLKMQYKNLFFKGKGIMPEWGLDFSQLVAEKIFA